jgi:dCTP deaminase
MENLGKARYDQRGHGGAGVILTDREIKLALGRGLIKIDPSPMEEAFSSTSVDLTLDPIINTFKKPSTGLEQVIDPSIPGIDYEQTIDDLTHQVTIGDDGYVLEPNKLILAWTAEYVDLRESSRLAARVEGKSSLARLRFVVHMTAPTIHAGFDGRIRLEMFNHGTLRIRLRRGMRLCQLIFEQTLGTPDRGYQGMFAGQRAL